MTLMGMECWCIRKNAKFELTELFELGMTIERSSIVWANEMIILEFSTECSVILQRFYHNFEL